LRTAEAVSRRLEQELVELMSTRNKTDDQFQETEVFEGLDTIRESGITVSKSKVNFQLMRRNREMNWEPPALISAALEAGNTYSKRT
jgi:hypothetical protein